MWNRKNQIEGKLWVISLLVCMCLMGCSDDDNITPEQPTAQGTFVDVRDGKEYHYVHLSGLDWLRTCLTTLTTWICVVSIRMLTTSRREFIPLLIVKSMGCSIHTKVLCRLFRRGGDSLPMMNGLHSNGRTAI